MSKRDQIAHLQLTTQYRHWLTIERMLKALDKYEHWQSDLQGSWRRPEATQ